MSITDLAQHSKTILQRLPDFDAADPEMWFRRVEGSFTRNRVTDPLERYHDVVAALPNRNAKEVRDIIMSEIDCNSYTRLREQIVKRLGSTQEEKTRQLLESEAMGDDKPSHFLRRLKTLAGSDVSDNVIRGLWIRRLPQSMQPILATQKEVPLATAAELADSILELLPTNSSTVAAIVPQRQESSDMVSLMQRLSMQCDLIQNRIAALEAGKVQRRGRSAQPLQRSKSRSTSRNGLCWYHRRFAEQARRCTPPCCWQQGNELGSR